ncbi:MAG: hypothetical protein ACE5F6_00450 [Anaerolineae bacterium]
MLYYLCHDVTEFGFTTTYIDVWLCGSKLSTIEELIEGCIDNRADYATQHTADNLRQVFELAKEKGYTRADTSMVGCAAKATIGLQHYQGYTDPDDRYCEPWFDLGRQLPRIKGGLKLVKRLQRMWKRVYPEYRPFTSPRGIVAVLKRLRAVKIELLEHVNAVPGGVVLHCTREKVSRQRRPSVHDMETVAPGAQC